MTTAPAPAGTLQPLAGLRVLDFSAFPPGGACTVMLADLGAEIVRVEPPSQKGKPSLVIGQVALSRGKRSMTLDMRHPASSEVLLRLAPTVDVVVENAKPGSMELRGFGYRQASERNEKLIWCAMTGFGQTGPNAEHAGHDISYLAHSGLLAAIAGELPWHPATMISVPTGAQAAVIAIQGALLNLARTGKGAFLDISLSESSGWFLTCGMNALSANPYKIGATPDRRLYRCADGRFVAVASAEPRTWTALCEGLELPALKGALHQPDLAADTAAKLEDAFARQPATEWIDLLAPLGAAVTIVNEAQQVTHDQQVVARGSVVDCGGVPVPASPIRIESGSARTGTCTSVPHSIGQDTEYVLASAGFAPEEIAALARDAVI